MNIELMAADTVQIRKPPGPEAQPKFTRPESRAAAFQIVGVVDTDKHPAFRYVSLHTARFTSGPLATQMLRWGNCPRNVNPGPGFDALQEAMSLAVRRGRVPVQNSGSAGAAQRGALRERDANARTGRLTTGDLLQFNSGPP